MLFRTLVLAVLFLTLGSTAQAGMVFSRLTPCPDDGRLVFQASDPEEDSADTLCLDPGTGDLAWGGGPIRGLMRGDGDTLLAATLVGVALVVDGRQVDFLPWSGQGNQVPQASVATWPATRRPLRRDAALQGRVLGEVTVFPERYVRLATGEILFLTDAEHPAKGGFLFVDLHARGSDGIEWLLRRNLEVRGWVVSPDSIHWALAAREHLPDYGGQVNEVLLVGRGRQMASFDVGTHRALLWDHDGVLWHLNSRGDAIRFLPHEQLADSTDLASARLSWRARELTTDATPCGCSPGSLETLWVWMAPGRYADPEPAQRVVSDAQNSNPDLLKRGWVAETTEYEHRAVWGGFLNREALAEAIADPPVPGARMTQVPVDQATFSGTVEKIVLNDRRGEASLRNVNQRGDSASEIWWRYFTHSRWVRMAGPWGLNAPGAAVDMPRTSP